jgi:hypothetical protein
MAGTMPLRSRLFIDVWMERRAEDMAPVDVYLRILQFSWLSFQPADLNRACALRGTLIHSA